MSQWQIEFYEDEDGRSPVREWIKRDLTPAKRRELGKTMRRILQEYGPAVCSSTWGRTVGPGIFEFRLSASDSSGDILLRVFCHAYGNRVVLLLHGYDKGRDPSKKRQQREIAEARRRLSRHLRNRPR